jgi:hypothetical protein
MVDDHRQTKLNCVSLSLFSFLQEISFFISTKAEAIFFFFFFFYICFNKQITKFSYNLIPKISV